MGKHQPHLKLESLLPYHTLCRFELALSFLSLTATVPNQMLDAMLCLDFITSSQNYFQRTFLFQLTLIVVVMLL